MTSDVHGLNGASLQLYGGVAEPVPEDHADIVVHGGGHTAGIVLPVPEIAKLAVQLTDALRERYGHDTGTVAGVLTPAQNEAVAYFRGLNVTANWFVGEPSADGRIEVLALGDTFIWSFIVDPDGQQV